MPDMLTVEGVGVGVGVGVSVAVAVAVAEGLGQKGVGVGQPAIVQDIVIPSDKLAVLQENWEKGDPVSLCRPTVAEAPVPFNVP